MAVYFWKVHQPYGELGQWFRSPFTDDAGNVFATAEQYLMYHKALAFNDHDTARVILDSYDAHPAEHRKIGRKVSNFNAEEWEQIREDIAYRANIFKFSQNPQLSEKLRSTGNMQLVEASPYDRIWGIGFDADNANSNRLAWGENLLGKVLEKVRDAINSQVSAHKVRSGQLAWRTDTRWEQPLVKSEGRDRYNNIDKWLYYPGLLCRIAGGEYVFVDTSNYWCNLASDEAMSRINSLVGILNATVNYDKSLKPFIKYIIKRCNANVGSSIPTSVCIGTERLEINLNDDTNEISFDECRSLLNISGKADKAVSTACIMPVDITSIPTSYVFPGKGDILSYIAKLFPDMRDLVTVMWHVGNCVVDPISRPKSLMLLGPGGSGKSTLLQIMFSVLVGCCGIIPDGSLTGGGNAMSSVVSEVIVSSRMAVCYDVGLEKSPLNMSTFKNISGSDYIRVGFNSCKSNCSLTLASNGIVNIEKQPDYLDDAILRRVVCILMNVDATEIRAGPPPEDIESRMDFLCACIHTRLKYETIPVTPMSLLLTLCGSKIDVILDYIYETDGTVDVLEGCVVLSIISNIIGTTTDKTIIKARLISPSTVIDIKGVSILRGLRTVD